MLTIFYIDPEAELKVHLHLYRYTFNPLNVRLNLAKTVLIQVTWGICIFLRMFLPLYSSSVSTVYHYTSLLQHNSKQKTTFSFIHLKLLCIVTKSDKNYAK